MPAGTLREEAVELSRQYLGVQAQVDVKRSAAGALTIAGRFNEAFVALMEARDAAMAVSDQLALARVALDLVDLLHWLGDLRRATEELEHARAAIEPIIGGQPVSQAHVIADIYKSISSIMAGTGPGTAADTAKLYRAYVEVIYYHGLILKARRRWPEAIACFQKVLPEYRSLGSGEAIEYQLAQIDLGQRNYEAALRRAKAIEHVFERGAYRPKRAVLHKTMAECHLGLGNLDEAFPLLREAILDLSTEHFDPDALWRAYGVLAQAERQSGDDDGMINAYREAIETIDGLRVAPLGYRLDSTFLEDKKELYTTAIEQAARTGRTADCCSFIESIKSRTLRIVLSVPRVATGDDSGLAGRFHAVSRELDAIDFKRARGEDVHGLRQTAQELRAERAILLERLRVSDPRWRRLTVPVTLDLQAVLEGLARRGQAAVTLFYDPPALTCLSLWQGEVRCARSTAGAKLAESLGKYQNNLLKHRPDVSLHDLSGTLGVAATDLIPADLLDVVAKARSLVVVPHGVLHLVPWSCLLHQGRRLFEYAPVSVVPSLGLLTAAASPRSRPKSVSLLGVAAYPDLPGLPPLPSVGNELTDIRDAYRAAGISVRSSPMGHQSTTADYLDSGRGLAESGHALHLSCHGTLDSAEPMRSALWFSDGKLDASVIEEKPSPFEEIVLSACYTGWRPTEVGGIVLNGDDILGIPGAFLEAGAASVLVSITQAEGHAARALTTHYHRRRAAGAPPLQAVQAAQIQMLGSAIAPGAWTGFTLYGCQ